MDFKLLISGTFIFFFGIWVCINAYNLGLGSFRVPGSGFVVFLVGAIMTVLSIMDIVKGLTSKGLGIKALLSLWKGTYWKKAILVFVGTTIYALVLNSLGFLILTPFFVCSCIRLLGYSKWLVTIVISIFSTFVFYGITIMFNLPISLLPEFLDF